MLRPTGRRYDGWFSKPKKNGRAKTECSTPTDDVFKLVWKILQVDKRRENEKTKRDRLNDEYLELVDKQRLYYKTVKEFQEECRKNEALLAQVDGA